MFVCLFFCSPAVLIKTVTALAVSYCCVPLKRLRVDFFFFFAIFHHYYIIFRRCCLSLKLSANQVKTRAPQRDTDFVSLAVKVDVMSVEMPNRSSYEGVKLTVRCQKSQSQCETIKSDLCQI